MATNIVSAGLKRGDLRSFLQRMLNGEVFVLTRQGVVTDRMLFDGEGFLVVGMEGGEWYRNVSYFNRVVNSLVSELKQEISAAEDENTAG